MHTLEYEYMREHFPLDEKVKTDILTAWMSCTYVKNVLLKHGIQPEFFARYFASKVINYAASIVTGENKAGNCPVIGVMLVFFDKKNIPLEDVFIICVNFKNMMLQYALEKNLLNAMLLHEICTLVDFNFMGVIQEYLALKYDSNRAPDVCTLVTVPSGEAENAIAVSSVGTLKATRAAEYVKEVEIDTDILEELAEIEQEAASSLGLTDTFSTSAKAEVIDLFNQYTSMIERLMEFQELSYALRVLVDLLENIDMEVIQHESAYIIIYTKAIISDLSAWRISVFIEQDAEDIHYLDKTLLSSIAQLQILLTPESDAESHNMEFF